MKKKIVALGMTVGLVASMGLMGCSNNTTTETAPTGTPATEVATEVATTESVTMEDIGLATDSTLEGGIEEVHEVVYGEIAEVNSGDVLVNLESGSQALFIISENTLVDGELEVGKLVAVDFDGIMTRSLPGQAPNVNSITTITEIPNTVETEESSGMIVNTVGVITEVNEDNIHFMNESDVEVVANISENTAVYEGMKVDDKVIIKHDDMMTMSYPGILPQVHSISLYDEALLESESVETTEAEVLGTFESVEAETLVEAQEPVDVNAETEVEKASEGTLE